MKVFIVPNYARPDAVEGAHALEHWLSGQGVEAVWAHDKKRYPDYIEDPSACQLVVSLGGDGTLLRAARIVGYSQIPMLGISYGHLGFLTTAGPDKLIETVRSALAGKLHVSHRATLAIESTFACEDGSTYQVNSFALNDFSVSRGGQGDMVQFEVSVSDNHIDTLRGDGFVVSTATGSTGYALAAGGPILYPSLKGVVLVPVAPHTLSNRPIVLPSDAQIDIKLTEVKDGQAYFDMQEFMPMEAGDVLHIHVGRNHFTLLHPAGYNHFDLLRRKLKWNLMPTSSRIIRYPSGNL